MRDTTFSTSHPAHPMGEAYGKYSASDAKKSERLVPRGIPEVPVKPREGREL